MLCFDIQLLDADRNVVATWSADKIFPMYIAQGTLAPGQTWRYTGEMPVDLRPGNYIYYDRTQVELVARAGERVVSRLMDRVRVVALTGADRRGEERQVVTA